MKDVYVRIREAMLRAPRRAQVAELQIQVIKYAGELQDVTGREFCERLGISASWGVEFAKRRKIAPRLREAGLDADRL